MPCARESGQDSGTRLRVRPCALAPRHGNHLNLAACLSPPDLLEIQLAPVLTWPRSLTAPC